MNPLSKVYTSPSYKQNTNLRKKQATDETKYSIRSNIFSN